MHGGLGCSNLVPLPALRMLDVPSSFLSQGDAEFLDHYSGHGFLAPPGRLQTLGEPRCQGVVKPEAFDAAGDQQSAVTNMSNITSASGEACSGSSAERDAVADGGRSAAQLPISSAGAGGGLNSNGLTVAVKRKRNLPGTPDPDAEVIALSPKTLMATNRFVCEICNKGFQRDQNLQLHRRGHNLPWKLKQRSSKEIRKRVYICPEPSCVHHDPARALGDLTGIKKHFCRKHGEKKWKCDKCSKRYAVQSDWKAHSKTCGTREYRCDCGTLFSRRDSFITHRAFCDALAEESARVNTGVAQPCNNAAMAGLMMGGAHSPSRSTLTRLAGAVAGAVPCSSTVMDALSPASRSSVLGGAGGSILDNSSLPMSSSSRTRLSLWLGSGPGTSAGNDHRQQNMSVGSDHFAVDPFGTAGGSGSFFSAASSDSFDGSKPAALGSQYGNFLGHVSDMAGLSALAELGGLPGNSSWPDKLGHAPAAMSSMQVGGSSAAAPTSSGVAGLPSVSSLLSQAHASSSAQTSATALLQKAAQMGATASNPSLLNKGFGNPPFMAAPNAATSWPPTCMFGGGGSHHHQSNFLPPMSSTHSHSPAGFLAQAQKSAQLDELRSTLSALSSNTETLKSSNSFMNAAAGPAANSIQGLISSMAPPSNSFSGSMNSQLNSSSGNPFGISSMNVENRNPNSLFSPARDDPFNLNSHARQQQQQQQHHSKLAMMAFSNNVPKSEDGVTRDFLGVRGINSLIHGAQEHAGGASFTKALSMRDMPSNLCPLGMDPYSNSPRDSLRSLNAVINAQPSPGRWADNA